MNAKIIDEKISYIEASNDPLSADIGIIKDNGINWLFDVGNDYRKIADLTDNYNIVISHFHQDHIGNIEHLKFNQLYVSKETFKHLPKSIIHDSKICVVEDKIQIGDLCLFPIASSHAKGSLGLEVASKYAFVGDALYGKFKNNQWFYNVQLLKGEITMLKNLSASYLLVSHFKGLVRPKDEVISELENIYHLRKPNQAEIAVELLDQ